MQNGTARSLRGIGLLICFAACAFSTPTTTITLTGDIYGPSLGGVYTSPYYGTVGSETNVPIICDDFASETYFNESWTAYVTNLSDVPSTTTPPLKWNGGYGGLDKSQAYTVAAYLATEIMTSGDNIPRQQDLSFALWGLFDAGDSPDPLLYTSAAGTLLQEAITYVHDNGLTTSNFADVMNASVTIYSWVPGSVPTCPGGNCPPPPQEFLRVSMPEPSYPALLAVNLLAVVGLVVVLRRRKTGIFNN